MNTTKLQLSKREKVGITIALVFAVLVFLGMFLPIAYALLVTAR